MQLQVLSLGPKFCIAPRAANHVEDEACIEEVFAQLDNNSTIPTENRGAVRADLVNAFNQYRRSPIAPTFITKNHIMALNELKKNNSLIIQKPDKGSGITVLNRSQYVSGLTQILSNQDKFQPIDRKFANVNNIECSINQLVKEMITSNVLNEKEAWLLKPRGSKLPCLYGLPKVHKLDRSALRHDVIPFRPILSMVGSPYHALAKWLCKVLSPIKNELCKHTVKDSFTFVNRIRDYNLSSSHMYSFDVCNLFTNVPLIETVDHLCRHITVSQPNFPIPIPLLRRLILICVKDIRFVFNGQTYKQIDGVSMGSPLGPLLADVFMAKLESTSLAQCIDNFQFYARYMDDTFVVSRKRMSKRQILKQLNDCHPAITFTIEEEENEKLPFLDVEIIRKGDGSVATRLYHKSTWTGQYINFHSFVHISMKRNIIRNLGSRIEKLVSAEFRQADMEILRKALLHNGYPEAFLDANLFSNNKRKCNEEDESNQQAYLRIQLRGDAAAELFIRKIKRSLKLNGVPVKPLAIFLSRPLITVQTKDRLPALATSNVVYQFTCSECKEQYIGLTERRLEQRIREHLPQQHSNGLSKASRSSIAEHIVNNGHWDNSEENFEILHIARNKKLLKFLEAVAIRRTKLRINAQRDLVVTLKLPWT